MGRLDGRVAIVTGAGGGIGREHARLLGREGAAVVVDDLGSRTGADAASVVEEIRAAGGTATADHRVGDLGRRSRDRAGRAGRVRAASTSW